MEDCISNALETTKLKMSLAAGNSVLERFLDQSLFSNKKEKKAKQIKQKIKDKMEK